jgi:hypothetical protein
VGERTTEERSGDATDNGQPAIARAEQLAVASRISDADCLTGLQRWEPVRAEL